MATLHLMDFKTGFARCFPKLNVLLPMQVTKHLGEQNELLMMAEFPYFHTNVR